MAELTVDLTYGSALYQAAVEVDKKDLILADAMQVLGIFEQEPEFFKLINYPAISAKEKKEIISNVFEGKICTEVLNLLYVLTDKGRNSRFPGIVKVYKDMLDKDAGVTYGTVYSVEPLSGEQIEKFEEEVSKLLQEKTKLENVIDKSLIGGVKIQASGRIIDASIRKRLEDLGNELI